MALERRKKGHQELWVATTSLAQSPGHPFYEALNRLLAEAQFDEQVESWCAPRYAGRGRRSWTRGVVEVGTAPAVVDSCDSRP